MVLGTHLFFSSLTLNVSTHCPGKAPALGGQGLCSQSVTLSSFSQPLYLGLHAAMTEITLDKMCVDMEQQSIYGCNMTAANTESDIVDLTRGL